MAKLLFFETNHEYQLDGEPLPSVSEITRFVSREVYGDVTQFRLDNAAERGTKIHKATELLDKYGSAEIDDAYIGYLQAYVKFRKEHDITYEKIEYATHHPTLNYAGTIDRFGTVDGAKAILDIKSSYAVQKVLYGAGQNLYRKMLEAQGFTVDKLYILHLIKDGTYKLIELEKSDVLADACLALHGALKKKPRKRKEPTVNGK